MDDFVILTRSRARLRREVRRLPGIFGRYGFERHPEKTQIGRIGAGFDWMGYWFDDSGCRTVSPRSRQNTKEKLRRLFGRLSRAIRRGRPKSVAECRKKRARVESHRERRITWAENAGLNGGSGHGDTWLVTVRADNALLRSSMTNP